MEIRKNFDIISRVLEKVIYIMSATFLTAEQIWGDQALGIFKKYGTTVGLSDLAVLLGGMLTDSGEKTTDGLRAGYVWSASSGDYSNVRCVDSRGSRYLVEPRRRHAAARPALPLLSLNSFISSHDARTVAGNVKVIEAGEYPQAAVSDSMAARLRAARRLDKYYTFDACGLDDSESFRPMRLPVYEYNGRRFVRVVAKRKDSDSILCDGRRVISGQEYWVEIEPVKWLVDDNAYMAVSHVALFAGIQFDTKSDYDGDFNRVFINKYLGQYFMPELTQFQTRQNVQDMGANDNIPAAAKSRVTPRTGFGVTIDGSQMSVRDQIKFYIENGKSFMLHGPSGVGKTGRVEAIDPDLTAVTLWNGVLPEDIVGKVRFPDGATQSLGVGRADGDDAFGAGENIPAGGVWVPPDWYTVLCQKCAASPDKKHVLFIDEVTNAKPTTQSLIFHIVLKGSISPSNGKLPKNAVVVLAGNDKVDSGAAYNMPAPLFRRMPGHIYLEPDLADWLEWGAAPVAPGRNRVHPLVANFVANNPDCFYTTYNEEEPEKWALDPRGWTQVSDIIYDNGNVLRRELLQNKIGPENTAALMAYATMPILTVQDVLTGNFGPDDIPNSFASKLALAMNLRDADGAQIGPVRQFISQYLGAEILAVFESAWAGNDATRLAQLMAQNNRQGK